MAFRYGMVIEQIKNIYRIKIIYNFSNFNNLINKLYIN